MKLSELGEFGLIDLCTRDLIHDRRKVLKGVGDDAAVLRTDGSKHLLFTTDMLVEDIHFSLSYMSFKEIGWKSLAVNISDIAAMGGIPKHGLVSIGIPPNLEVEEVELIYAGLRECARRWQVNVVGGDTVKSPGPLVINMALLGEVEENRLICRSGACPGDFIYVTGSLGASAAGLYTLQNQEKIWPEEIKSFVRRAHLLPVPRVREGRALASTSGVSAMDDISDGLAGDISHICTASGVGCIIEVSQIPVSPEVVQAARIAGRDPLDWALYGGEDYELLFTVRPEAVSKVEQVLFEAEERGPAKAGERNRVRAKKIGRITGDRGKCYLMLLDGSLKPLAGKAYNHFS